MTLSTGTHRLMASPDHPHDTRQRPITESRPESGRDGLPASTRDATTLLLASASHTTCRTLPCASGLVRHGKPQPRGQTPRPARARPASRRRAVAHRTVVRDKGKEIGSVLAPPQRSRAAPWGIEGQRQMQGCERLGHLLAPRRRPAMRLEKEGFQASTRRLPS